MNYVDCHIGGSLLQSEGAKTALYGRVYKKIDEIFKDLPYEFTYTEMVKAANMPSRGSRAMPWDEVLRRQFSCVKVGNSYRKPIMTKNDYSIAEQNKQDIRIYVGRNPGKSVQEIADGLGWRKSKVFATLGTMKDEYYNGVVLKPQ